MRIYAKDIKLSQHAEIAGWVHEKRILGSIIFLILRDYTGFIQVTAKKENTDEKLFNMIKTVKKECVVSVEGEVVNNKNAPGNVEVIPRKMNLISGCESLPIDISPGIKTSLDKRLDFRCIDLRRPENLAIFKIQSMLIQEFQAFLAKEGFLQIFTPCLMGVASESGSEVFSVLYYDKEAFLRQDPQLHRQLAIAGGLEKIYDVGPSWRAEVSHTTRHLCEHRTIAVEMAFIKDEYDVMDLEERMVIYAMKRLAQDCKDELRMFNAKIDVPRKFPVLEFPKLYDILEELNEKVKRGEESYGTEGEKLLGEYVKKKYNSDFFFVNRFPYAEKPFYVMRYDDVYARSTDFIYRGTELSSGGQREHRYEEIIKQIRDKGMSTDSVKWFSDFFKYGVPPHGGFAIGIERLTMRILGLGNVREAALFPRDVERLVP